MSGMVYSVKVGGTNPQQEIYKSDGHGGTQLTILDPSGSKLVYTPDGRGGIETAYTDPQGNTHKGYIEPGKLSPIIGYDPNSTPGENAATAFKLYEDNKTPVMQRVSADPADAAPAAPDPLGKLQGRKPPLQSMKTNYTGDPLSAKDGPISDAEFNHLTKAEKEARMKFDVINGREMGAAETLQLNAKINSEAARHQKLEGWEKQYAMKGP